MATIPKPPIYKATLLQLTILCFVTAGIFWFGRAVAGSVFLGGLTQLVPQAWFSYAAFKHIGASQTDLIVRSMYRGETGKVVLTASAFITTFVLFKEINIIGFMAAFVGMIPLQLFLVAKIVK
jgi:ATP synthase protein I